MTCSVKNKVYFLALFSLCVSTGMLYADDGSVMAPATDTSEQKADDARALAQFPRAEMAPIAPVAQQQAQVQAVSASAPDATGRSKQSSMEFPKVQSPEDEAMAKRFSWWPTDAKPAPVKDENRSGYWWWPDLPGQARPWGNQGWVYVRKIIFDYKTSEGQMKPSLIIKRVIKNVKAYFDYDKSDLRDDTRALLDRALFTLERNLKADILITGNADTRGSEQYNMKLGENRAEAVRQYFIGKGLSEARIRILSRGKLDAMAPTDDIVGMQKDRNAQFMIAEVEEVMIPAEKAHLFQDKIIEERKDMEGAIKVATKDYVIQEGDSLWKIAKEEYGNGMQWKRIYEFNKDVISNPDRPRKGTRIKIPIE